MSHVFNISLCQILPISQAQFFFFRFKNTRKYQPPAILVLCCPLNADIKRGKRQEEREGPAHANSNRGAGRPSISGGGSDWACTSWRLDSVTPSISLRSTVVVIMLVVVV
jgi:hypothetical protein